MGWNRSGNIRGINSKETKLYGGERHIKGGRKGGNEVRRKERQGEG